MSFLNNFCSSPGLILKCKIGIFRLSWLVGRGSDLRNTMQELIIFVYNCHGNKNERKIKLVYLMQEHFLKLVLSKIGGDKLQEVKIKLVSSL